MDVVVDDVVRRRRDIDRRPAVVRDRHEQRLREDEQPDRCKWRRQLHEIRWWRRQEEIRRRGRRRKVEVGVAEIQHRAIDIDDLVGRRRRHVIVQHRK
jgi:hypothetical protein